MKNFNQKNNFESDIDEAKLGANVKSEVEGVAALRGSALEGAFRDMEVAIGLKNNPILLRDVKTGGVAELRTADDIFNAIKDGKLKGAELGRVEKGLLKSTKTSPGIRKSISIDFAKDKKVLGELAKNNRNTTAEIKDYLKGKGYPPESINEIVAQMKANGAIDAKGLLVKDASKVANTGGKVASKTFGTRIKELLSNIKIKKMSWKQLLVWGAGLGIGGYALWYLIKQNSDVIPDGTPTTPPNPKDDWGPCLTDLIKLKQAKIATTPKGQSVVYVPTTEKYPEGLQFYSNGRVINVQTKEMGTWSCVAGKAQTNENMNKPKLNESIGQIVKRVLNERYLMEQSDADIDKDVNKMINFLDFPVSQKDLLDAYNLLVKYSTSPKVQDFLHYYEKSGHFLNTSLRTTLTMIYTSEPGSVRLKEKLISLLDQIESGKVTPIQTNTNQQQQQSPRKVNIIGEQSGESDLKIVWDKDKKAGGGNTGGGGGNSGGGGGGGTTRKSYYDCSGVNIETTPLTYGCKDQKIAQIQACLGLSSDGKFGPNTLKALKDNAYDTKNGITKAIYDKVMEGCKKGSVAQTATSTEGGADVKYLRTPIKMDLGPVPQMPAKNTSASGAPSSEGMTDTAYYNSLVQNGLFNATGILGRTAYNGPALEPSELQKVNNVLTSMGYVQDRVKATDGGAKYIWQKQ